MSSRVDDVAATAALRPTAAVPTRAAGKAATTKTFAATLEDATSTTATGGAAAPASGSTGSTPALRPTGETLQAVAGHPYARIASGPDTGMYLNTEKGNPREGEAFHIEHRHGLTLHVYGSGADEQIEVVRPVAATGGTLATTS